MGIHIFEKDEWDRIRCGTIGTPDFMCIDKERDERLLNFMLHRAAEPVAKRGMLRHRLKEMPEPMVNIDYPEDERYPEYIVLSEQVVQEDDTEVLKAAALNSSDWNMAAFAFCRLTGYSWPPDECDAYSYRTYECGLKADMTRGDIEAFCHEMIERNGRFADEARAWLRELPNIRDEMLDGRRTIR